MMAEIQSLEVRVKEGSASTQVEAPSTSIGALVGNFSWGSVDELLLAANEQDLVRKSGTPDNQNYKDWFTAKNFLNYSSALRYVRIVGAGALNSGDVSGHLVENDATFAIDATLVASGNSFIARYAGIKGNGITVSVADSTTYAAWTHANEFSFAPTGDEFFIVVLLGGVIVERHYVSKDPAGRDAFNRNIYAADLINTQSSYIFVVPQTLITSTAGVYDAIGGEYALASGNDGVAPLDGDYTAAWTKHFSNQDTIEVNLLMQGGASTVVGQHIMQNVASVRLDAQSFHSPMETDVVAKAGVDVAVTAMKVTRNAYPANSKGVFDGNYKYQKDLYNDIWRWVPLNGDHAGLYARTDYIKSVGSAASGHNRGQVKEVTKFAIEPNLANRNDMSNAQINPFVTFDGDGPLLYLDKTLLTKPNAFDSVGPRRLFNMIETAISRTSRFTLSEFNTPKEQAKFKRSMDMYFRGLIGRGDVVRALVVCDATTNTPDVVNAKNFSAKFYIEAPLPIRGIMLEFISTPFGVSFNEVIG